MAVVGLRGRTEGQVGLWREAVEGLGGGAWHTAHPAPGAQVGVPVALGLWRPPAGRRPPLQPCRHQPAGCTRQTSVVE